MSADGETRGITVVFQGHVALNDVVFDYVRRNGLIAEKSVIDAWNGVNFGSHNAGDFKHIYRDFGAIKEEHANSTKEKAPLVK